MSVSGHAMSNLAKPTMISNESIRYNPFDAIFHCDLDTLRSALDAFHGSLLTG